jgi:acyl dehydratase/NAD(P)-dependent dehydrogenase (short-subunit alcohol dehydrogenase family)
MTSGTIQPGRTFDLNDQHRFAALSGDANPFHVDPVAARRLMYGQPVVHGVHTLLWVLDRWLAGIAEPALRLTSVRAEFRQPLRLGQAVFWSCTANGERQARLEAATDTAKIATVVVRWQEAGVPSPAADRAPGLETPHDLAVGAISGVAGTVPASYDHALAAALLPVASAKLPGDQFAALLASTRVVGVRVPGLHSLFNHLDLRDARDSGDQVHYAVESFDERFARVVVTLRGSGLAGTLSAIVRPAPVQQPSYAVVARSVRAGEFAGQRALVIGGSRGLGEIGVKQLAAGGAEVRFSYHQGETEAAHLTAEIAAGGGRATPFRHDARERNPGLEDLLREFRPTLLFFFSTPSVAGAPRGRFDPMLFHDLCRVYVDGFLAVFVAAAGAGSLVGAMQPSSIFVEELPAGMAEYATAKTAAETMIATLRAGHPQVRFHTPRWGRMLTDLAASVLAADTADPLPVVLAALRRTAGDGGPG